MSFNVLLVDDEDDIRMALKRCLRREGYTLVEASGGAEALSVVARQAIDIVVTDQMMPEMTGLELLKRMRDVHPHIVRIVLTGYADFDVVKSAINEAEIFRFLTKPWDDDDLRLTLRNAAHRLSLERENTRLSAKVREHEARLRELERNHPGITSVMRDDSGAIVIDEDEVAA